MFNVKKA